DQPSVPAIEIEGPSDDETSPPAPSPAPVLRRSPRGHNTQAPAPAPPRTRTKRAASGSASAKPAQRQSKKAKEDATSAVTKKSSRQLSPFCNSTSGSRSVSINAPAASSITSKSRKRASGALSNMSAGLRFTLVALRLGGNMVMVVLEAEERETGVGGWYLRMDELTSQTMDYISKPHELYHTLSRTIWMADRRGRKD
ncbi:hypothetical protein FRC03_003019, partial [Tulasnella sp. 419]